MASTPIVQDCNLLNPQNICIRTVRFLVPVDWLKPVHESFGCMNSIFTPKKATSTNNIKIEMAKNTHLQK